MKLRGSIAHQGIIPGVLRKRWRWVKVNTRVRAGDRFCFVGIGPSGKRGFLPVEHDQIGMNVPSWYRHRFIRVMSASPAAGTGKEGQS